MFITWLMLVVLLSVNGLTLAFQGSERSSATPSAAESFYEEREAMVATQLVARGLRTPDVLAAMRKVPRHEFVPSDQTARAYADRPLPIGYEQTISQPYIVALMTDLAEVASGDRVLEVGTGSGYQAAVLAALGAKVFTIEIVAPLGRNAAATLRRLGYNSVQTRIGDGYLGWPDAAPFDAILVTAAPPRVPPALLRQLAIGGRMVVPVGDDQQILKVITRTEVEVFDERSVVPVRFVPMVGGAPEPVRDQPEHAR